MTLSLDKRGTLTLAEILSQPACWAECLGLLEASDVTNKLRRSFKAESHWLMVGCGSSYYVALGAAATWTALTGQRATALPASEILLFPDLALAGPGPIQPVFISRSGRTSEILKAAEFVKQQRHLNALAISCVPGQPLEGLSGMTVILPPADEQSTVMTRSFSSMLLALQFLGAGMANDRAFQDTLHRLSGPGENLLASLPARLQGFVADRTFADYAFLGQGPLYGIANEAMLKVKEMSCSYAQCFHTLEFRHGPKAIVSPETLVTFFLSESGFNAEREVLEEVKSLGGTTLVVTNHADSATRQAADFLVELKAEASDFARLAAYVVPVQLLGLVTGIRKGFNPDRPPNLTRAVILKG